MRPIERGPVPQVSVTTPQGTVTQDKTYAKYQYARGDLIGVLGDYCSYCERRLSSDCAVEHVQPKKGAGAQPLLALSWENFLLGCRNCNSVKKDKAIALADYFWPDLDNTFRAFVYSAGGAVQVNTTVLTTSQIQTAIRTMDLTGFAGNPTPGPTLSDRRRLSRSEVWDIAQMAFDDLQGHDYPALRRQIMQLALGYGYFSVWMTVFASDTDMKLRFINAFNGTASSCFDAQGDAVPRLSGHL